MNKFQQLPQQDQELIKQLLGGQVNEGAGDVLKKLSLAGLIVLGSLLAKQSSAQSTPQQYGPGSKVNFETVNKVVDGYTKSIFGNKATEAVNSGIVPTILGDGSVMYFKIEDRFQLTNGNYIAFKVNKYNKIDLIEINKSGQLVKALGDYTNLSGEQAMEMVEKLTMGRINQTLREPNIVAQIQNENKHMKFNLRQMIRESISNVLSEMPNIATLFKLSDNFQSKLDMADERVKLSKSVIKMVDYLKANPEGTTLKAAADSIYGVPDTARTSSTIRLLKSLGIVEDIGLEHPRKEKTPNSGIQGRPKVVNDDVKSLGISVIRKYSAGKSDFTPEELEFIDKLYQSARFGGEVGDETIDENQPTTLPKPVVKPDVKPAERPIRRPLTPPETTPDTKPKAEAEIVDKIAQRYNSLK